VRGVPPSRGVAKRAARASPPRAAVIRSLTHRADFERLFATGHRTRAGGVTVIRAESHHDGTRVAVVAGRRVGNAVRRNRAKRRLREAIRSVGLPQGEDLIVIAGPGVPDVAFQKLVSWIDLALQREAGHVR
jgi:ribonuclease P protein component